jgi:hypothetical protein
MIDKHDMNSEHAIVVMTKPLALDFVTEGDLVLLKELLKRINSNDCSAMAGRKFSKENGGLPRGMLKNFYAEHKDNEKKFQGILDYFSGTEAIAWCVTPKRNMGDREFEQWVEYFTLDVIGETNPHKAVENSYRRLLTEVVPGYEFSGFVHEGKLYSFDNAVHRSGSAAAAIRERRLLKL